VLLFTLIKTQYPYQETGKIVLKTKAVRIVKMVRIFSVINGGIPHQTAYKALILIKTLQRRNLPSTGLIVYRCKEHPNTPEYYDLKGWEEIHFNLFISIEVILKVT
jgi:hypothetical protein